MVAAMLEVFFSRRAGRFNGNNVKKQPKIGHFSGLPSFRFSWKLKKLCQVDFLFLNRGRPR
jgi:hypothetical protein